MIYDVYIRGLRNALSALKYHLCSIKTGLLRIASSCRSLGMEHLLRHCPALYVSMYMNITVSIYSLGEVKKREAVI